jgi:DNA-binding IclR family transcriptional regulator
LVGRGRKRVITERIERNRVQFEINETIGKRNAMYATSFVRCFSSSASDELVEEAIEWVKNVHPRAYYNKYMYDIKRLASEYVKERRA